MSQMKSNNNSSDKGKTAEIAANAYLKKNGFKTIAENFLCKGGEIDLIAMQKNLLVFVEVRFRANDTYGTAQATVTKTKQKKITTAANIFLQRHPRYQNHDCRFDVIAITNNQLEWIENAFYPQQ